jgi:tryptophan halogenase
MGRKDKPLECVDNNKKKVYTDSMKKLAIIGRGTAGAFAATHFLHHAEDCEITLYHDPVVKPQAVGEGSSLVFPRSLHANIRFSHEDLEHLDGSFKSGIYKTGWGDGHKFMHNFPPPNVGYHFNAVKFQDFILSRLKNSIKIVEADVTADDIDADFVMDCSGKPGNYDEYVLTESIPVNSVYVTQCYWDHPRFQYTLTIARPYGWVFGIPLRNRCSIGYMYNSSINTLEEVKEDVKQIFKDFNLNPSDTTNSFSFRNYYRKQNFTERVAYNGNASFFLEPLEATSIGFMDQIQRIAFVRWFYNEPLDWANQYYTEIVKEIESVIMLHYLAGSVYDTEFWRFAQERAKTTIREARKVSRFNEFVRNSALFSNKELLTYKEADYGTWSVESFKQNLTHLNLYNKIIDA